MSLECGSCHHANREGARFCQECGAPLSPACGGCGNEMAPGAKFCDACGRPASSATGSPASGSASGPAAAVSPSTSSAAHPAMQTQPTAGDLLCGGRYRVERFLGEGSRKRVYLARDTRLGRDIAIAVVPSEGLDIVRLRREAEAMGRLGDHAHIVTVHDVVEEAGRILLVCEFMAGGDLGDRLTHADGRRLPIDEALRISDEVCDALTHAHSNGIVHRDLKPGNVWLSENGSARLGDFGLAVSTDRTRITQEGTIVGTAAYMPPEQAVGGAVTAQSDLYSLGAMLYEMLTGRPPFIGEDSVAVISQHLNASPVMPSWHNPDVVPQLEALVLALLAKEPSERPASAENVRARLAEIRSAPPPATSEIAAVARLQKSHFVGREEELKRVHQAIDRAIGGAGSILVLAGEPGIGKTFLATQAATYAGLRGAEVLSGHSHENDAGIAYLPFVEALRALFKNLPAEELRKRLGSAGGEIVRIMPELRERLPHLEASPPSDPEEDRFRLFDGVASVLAGTATDKPLMIVLDDLHWADRGSLRLLEHLSRRLATSRILVVGTYRDVELDRRHPLSESLAELRRSPGFERVALRGLGQAEVLEVFRRMVHGEDLDSGASKLADMVFRETEGNPFFVDSVVRHLAESGAMERVGGRWVTHMETALEVGIPEGVRDAIGRRLSTLSDTTSSILTNASILGREFEFAVLKSMSDASEDEVLDALDEAVERQMIEEADRSDTPTYRFSHALVYQSLFDELSMARRQRKMARAAEAIEAVHGGSIEPHVAQLARLYRQAGSSADQFKARQYAMQAGKMAARVLAWEEAAEHWRQALDAWGDGDRKERAKLLERFGDVLFNAGTDKAGAVAGLEEALEIYGELGEPLRVAAVHARLARAHTFPSYLADYPRSIAHGRKAEAILREEPPGAGLVLTLMTLSASLQSVGDTDQSFEKADEAHRLATELHAPVLVAAADVVWCSLAQFMGRFRAAAPRAEESWKLAVEGGINAVLGMAISNISVRWSILDCRSFEELERGLERIPTSSRSQRNLATNSLAQNLAHAGRIDELREVLPLLVEQGFGEVHAWLYEDWDRAEELQRKSGDLMRRTGNIGHLVWHDWARGRIAWLKGDLKRATELHETALGLAIRCKGVRDEFHSRADLGMIAATRGDIEIAEAQLARCNEIVAIDEDWGGFPGVVAKLRGAIAAARGRLAEAAPNFEEAIAIFRESKVPFEVAEVYFVWGDALLRGGDRRASLDKFNAALAIYRRLNASAHWIERVIAVKMRAQGSGSSDALASIAVVAAHFESQRPSLESIASNDGHVTLMFSDLADFTKMTERLGDREAHRVMTVHNNMVREICQSHGGSEVELRGDGFLLAFPSPAAGMRCAVDLQQSFSRYNEGHPELPLHLRIGLHEGEAIRDEDKFFGRTVIKAFRIADLAVGGEILISEELETLGRSESGLRFGEGREVTLKGIAEAQRVVRLEWS